MALGLALSILGACGEDAPRPEPRWIPLSASAAPRLRSEDLDRWDVARELGREASLRIDADGASLWVDVPLGRKDWTREGDRFWTPRPCGARSQRYLGEKTELSIGGRPILRLDVRAAPPAGKECHYLDAERLWLVRADTQAPAPVEAVYSLRFELGRLPEQGSSWRAYSGDTSATGYSLPSGTRVSVEVDVPDDSVLRFATRATPIRAGAGPSTFRVLVAGEPRLSHVQRDPSRPPAQHVLDLPPGPATITFLLEGPPAVGAILAPTIGPAEVGRAGNRPWESAGGRADVLLFLADTFRADNMETYGGRAGVTPALDALAGESLVFERARSTSSWTLPSQTSMLTGLYPSQHRALHPLTAISETFVTLAERLREAGWRTGAVTDSGIVSRTFRFDQGFEWFEETLDWDLQRTFERADAFLARDDGRPTFLFLQTFRVHSPYRTGPDEDETAWRTLHRDYPELQASKSSSNVPVGREAASRYHDLYLRGVGAFDAAFGAWLARLDADPPPAPPYLVFTSDHGEGFGEHGQLDHGKELFEEQLLVPLLIRGHDLAPGRSSLAASLVDLPRTIATLARIDPSPAWRGASLIHLTEDRPLFAQRRPVSGQEELVLVSGGKKIFARAKPSDLSEGRFLRAYDLSQDPLELEPILPDSAAPTWPTEFTRRLAPTFAEVAEPLTDYQFVDVGSELKRRLQALGYLQEE